MRFQAQILYHADYLFFYFYFYFLIFYVNYIMHCKIKRDNHKVPKIEEFTGIKQILRKEKKKFTKKI